MCWKNNYLEFRILHKLAHGLLIGLVICFPFYVWFAGWDYPVATAIYLVTIGIARLATILTGTVSAVDWLMVLVPIALGLLVSVLGTEAGLYYPVAVNLGFLLLFYASLSAPKNFIQCIAEKIEKRPLDSIGIKYTNYLTRIWCVVFLMNATISIYLAWHEMLEKWTLYNGVVAYLAVATLFLGERLMRDWIQQKMRYSSTVDNRRVGE